MTMQHDLIGIGDGRLVVSRAWRNGLRPQSDLTVHEWADRFRWLSREASAEAARFQTSRTPYLREPMEHLSPSSPVPGVVIQKAAQVGGTECANNWVGYLIDRVGGALIVVQPTVDMAKRWSRQRLAPMLRDTPVLSGKVREARSRDSGNTILAKEFAGGIVIATGANSATGLRSMPAPWVVCDEVDAYPPDSDGEGHAVDIVHRRSATFFLRKLLEISTPGVMHASRIATDFERSDRSYFNVPCPHCMGWQVLDADRLVYPEDEPGDCLGMVCLHCGAIIEEGHKPEMLAAGQWWRLLDNGQWGPRPPVSTKMVGYHLSTMMSPLGWTSWAEMAVAREAAKVDESKAKTYANLWLGVPYEEKTEAPDWRELYGRRGTHAIGVVPIGAYVLTAAIDVQRRRIEVQWYAWGPSEEAWWIDHEVVQGDTAEDETWAALDQVIDRAMPHAEGAARHRADLVVIDMGYETEAVKRWVLRRREPRRIIAIQGSDVWGSPVVIGWSETGRESRRKAARGSKSTSWRRGFPFVRVAVSSAKLEVYRRIRRSPGEGPTPWGGPWLHLPQISEEHVQQLVSEKVMRKRPAGRRQAPGVQQPTGLEWVKTRDRNEQLDLTVYNLAAAALARLDRTGPRGWARLRRRWQIGKGAATAPVVDAEAVAVTVEASPNAQDPDQAQAQAQAQAPDAAPAKPRRSRIRIISKGIQG